MKKRIIFLGLTLALLLTGCGKQPDPNTDLPEKLKDNPNIILPTYPAGTKQESSLLIEETMPEIFGEPQMCPAEPKKGKVSFSCNIPETDRLWSDGRSNLLTTPENIILAMGTVDWPEDARTLTEAFSCIPEQLITDYQNHLPFTYKDFGIEEEEQTTTNINGIDMERGRLRMFYTDPNGYSRTKKIILYAAKLSDGSIAYMSADYYEGEKYIKLKEIALNMALTFTEVRQ